MSEQSQDKILVPRVADDEMLTAVAGAARDDATSEFARRIAAEIWRDMIAVIERRNA